MEKHYLKVQFEYILDVIVLVCDISLIIGIQDNIFVL